MVAVTPPLLWPFPNEIRHSAWRPSRLLLLNTATYRQRPTCPDSQEFEVARELLLAKRVLPTSAPVIDALRLLGRRSPRAVIWTRQVMNFATCDTGQHSETRYFRLQASRRIEGAVSSLGGCHDFIYASGPHELGRRGPVPVLRLVEKNQRDGKWIGSLRVQRLR